MDDLILSETLLRGATAGLLLLVAAVLLRYVLCCLATRFGALFALGIAAYAIKSSPLLFAYTGFMASPLIFLAMQCVVFFWWFALAALDDEFNWQSWHWMPFATTAFLFGVQISVVPFAPAANILCHVLMIGLASHVLWIALAERRDDLIEQRRMVRIVFVVVIGITCLGTALLELFVDEQQLPQWVMTLQAAELFIMALVFSTFLLQPAAPLIQTETPPTAQVLPDLTPADQYELQKLNELMAGGFYTRDGLTIREVANAIEIPEHRLRRLINQQLGFRNFTSYLNSHRLSDARDILADPAQARRQITQIAFELGYGSIAPFNRAFKAEEGMTPTEFRRVALTENQQHVSVTH